MGSDLRGVINGEWFGNSVAISSDGNRVAVSGKYAKHFTEASVSGATYWGVVRVYDWVSDDDWIQQGLSVYGNDIPYTWASQHKGQFGNSLSISDDGLRLAVGEMSTSRMVMLEIPPWTQSVAPAPSSSSPGASPGASPEASPETPSNGDKPASQPAKEKKEKAEKTRDAILGDITNTRLKAKAKLLADAAIAGVKVKRLSAKLTADNEETACSTAFTKAGMSSGDGACVATAASSGKRRRLSSTTYDVELMFSSSTVSDDALAAAELEMKNNGVEGLRACRPTRPWTRSPSSRPSLGWTRVNFRRLRLKPAMRRRRRRSLRRHHLQPRRRRRSPTLSWTTTTARFTYALSPPPCSRPH